MKFEIESTEILLDDFFRIEAARLRYERFDGTMSRWVRRVRLDVGPCCLAVVWMRDTHVIETWRWHPDLKSTPAIRRAPCRI